MVTQRLMKIIAKEDEHEVQEWTAHTAKETKRLLDDAIAYQKHHGKITDIVVHFSGWLTHCISTIGVRNAKKYIDKSFESALHAIKTYDWIASGTVEGKVRADRHYIYLNVTTDVTRTEESQAQSDARDEALAKIYEEEE